MSNIARETGISVSTVRDHYGILVDTLMGAFSALLWDGNWIK
jgi:hypothetical protein